MKITDIRNFLFPLRIAMLYTKRPFPFVPFYFPLPFESYNLIRTINYRHDMRNHQVGPQTPSKKPRNTSSQRPLTGLVETQRDNVRVQHGGVERGDEEVEVSDHDGHGAVDDALGAIHEAQRLVREARVVARERQWRVPG